MSLLTKALPRTADIVLAAANSQSRGQADLICGADAAVDINAAFAALPVNGHLHLLSGTYNILTPIECNIDNITMSTGGYGTIINVAAGFVGAYAMRVISTNPWQGHHTFKNMLFIDCNDLVATGLVIDNCWFDYYDYIRIIAFTAIGIQLYAHNATAGMQVAENHFSKIDLVSNTAVTADLRGIVFIGDAANLKAATTNYFEDVSIDLQDAVALSYGVDFQDFCDNNYFAKLQLPGSDHLTAGIIFNSGNPTTPDRYCHNNHIAHFIYEPSTDTDILIQSNVIGMAAMESMPNRIDKISWHSGRVVQLDDKLEIGDFMQDERIKKHVWLQSIDGLSQAPGAGGAITLANGYATLDSGNAGGTTSMTDYIVYPTLPHLTPATWSYPRKFTVQYIPITATINETDWCIWGAVGVGRHVGFKTVNGNIYGTCGDGVAESTLDLGIAIVAWQQKNLFVSFIPGVAAYFSVDGVYLGSITTNLPTTNTSANLIHFQLTAGGAEVNDQFAVTSYKLEQCPH